jgi:hypothetical protein
LCGRLVALRVATSGPPCALFSPRRSPALARQPAGGGNGGTEPKTGDEPREPSARAIEKQQPAR